MKGVGQLNLCETAGGVIVPVKAVAGSSRDRIVGVLGDCLKIVTSAAPEKGKANAAIAKTLAAALGLDRRSVTLHSGQTNPRKEFLVAGLSPDSIRECLEKI